jgi:hypothetical protein
MTTVAFIVTWIYCSTSVHSRGDKTHSARLHSSIRPPNGGIGAHNERNRDHGVCRQTGAESQKTHQRPPRDETLRKWTELISPSTTRERCGQVSHSTSIRPVAHSRTTPRASNQWVSATHPVSTKKPTTPLIPNSGASAPSVQGRKEKRWTRWQAPISIV